MLKIYKSYTELNRRKEEGDSENFRLNVLNIIKQVQEQGDKALYKLTEEYDKVQLKNLRVNLENTKGFVEPKFVEALEKAYERIYSFHQKQRRESWFTTQDDGSILGQKLTPINRVGIYVPGGTAAYPSSVLMNGIPAKVAGVKEIVMVTPPNKDGDIDSKVLLAAKMVGIEEIYLVGGAQGIAALAYGTESIRPVDKIVGPGNIYVALAKREVFGQVGIDSFAGPSEISIVADKNANAKYIAADLLSQAEHDPMSSPILITNSYGKAEEVNREIRSLIQDLPRKDIAKSAILNYGGIIYVDSLTKAFDEVNQIAPEHLELMVDNPFEWLPMIQHAGAIFLGEYSPEPIGDYFAGPNHVLPTNGTARFSSPLNVDDFIKKSSIISFSKSSLNEHGNQIITFAENEGLDAHALSIKVRMEDNDE